VNDSLSRRDLLAGSLGAAAAALLTHPGVAAHAARGPLIDTHVHFYDPSRPEGVPWPDKKNAVLYRTVLPDEWERLVAPLGTGGTIVVEASEWVEDNQWLLDLAEKHAAARLPGMLGIVGVVGRLPLEDDSSAALIDRFAKHRGFRGIRVPGAKLLAGLADAGYMARLGKLSDHGLTLDVNHGPVLEAVEAAAARFPELRIVINHMANTPITEAGPLPEWLAGIEKVARRPNVWMKVSGLVESAAHAMKLPKAPLEPAFYEPWLDAVWKAFGVERLLYGSNWPVSDQAATYPELFGIVEAYARARGAEAERWFFSAASRAAYRWE